MLPAPKRRVVSKRPLEFGGGGGGSFGAPAPAEPPPPAPPVSNEAYRVPAGGAADAYRVVGVGVGHSDGAAASVPYPPPADAATAPYPSATADYDTYAAMPAPRAADAALEAALAAEARSARRRGAPALGVSFVEVSADTLTAVTPGDAARSAALAEASAAAARAAALAAAAAPGDAPDRVAKRKHQITALLHQARAAETDYAATAARGAKTKAETRGKYGW